MQSIVLQVDGLEFRADSHEDEPRVLDTEIGARARLARPRTIRDVIKRHLASGFLNDSDVRRVERRQKIGNLEQVLAEYWLTETGALKVITKLETPQAHALVGEMVRVYRAAIRMLHEPVVLPPAPPPSTQGFHALLAACTTVGEHPEWTRDVSTLIAFAAMRTKVSWARAHGALRKHLGVVGYKRIPAALLDEAKRFLYGVGSGALLLAKPKANLKLLTGDNVRQLPIPFQGGEPK